MEEKRKTLVIDSLPETRAGKHATLVMASTRDGETKLDFIEVDISDENGDQGGVLSARIYMSNKDLADLRDMLVRHTAQWGESDDREL